MTAKTEYRTAGNKTTSKRGLHHLVEAERVVPRRDAKILLVDDSETNLYVGNYVLKKLGFNHIYEARDGHNALELAKLHQPNATIIDTNMPRMPGYDLCKKLRSIYGSRMIIIGNSEDHYNATHWEGVGADSFLNKGIIFRINKSGADCPFVQKIDTYFPK